jgi:hypothetical protein
MVATKTRTGESEATETLIEVPVYDIDEDDKIPGSFLQEINVDQSF